MTLEQEPLKVSDEAGEPPPERCPLRAGDMLLVLKARES